MNEGKEYLRLWPQAIVTLLLQARSWADEIPQCRSLENAIADADAFMKWNVPTMGAWRYHNTPVLEFHKAFGHPIAYEPTVPPLEQRLLRVKLAAEELTELASACNVSLSIEQDDLSGEYKVLVCQDHENDQVDLEGAADALGDMRYVNDGSNLVFGFPGDDILAEIHASNMSKLGADGKPITREDGKTLKGPNYWKPNIRAILAMRYSPEYRLAVQVGADPSIASALAGAPAARGRLGGHSQEASDLRELVSLILTGGDDGYAYIEQHGLDQAVADAKARLQPGELVTGEAAPIPMVLHCPKCNHQHIDAPEDHDDRCSSMSGGTCDCARWTNPPHRSHWCDHCGTIWRPADVATTGVAAITTRGKADNWPQLPDQAVAAPMPGEPGDRAACVDLLGLVGYAVEQAAVDQWTDAQVSEAIAWAAATHLHASDNDDVHVPPRPAWLPEPWKGEDTGDLMCSPATPVKALPREGATA